MIQEKNLYTVKETAEKTELSEHTVRYYTNLGLVPNLKRNNNRNRLFDDEAINCLIGIKYLRETGMSIEDIKGYIALCLEGKSTIYDRFNIILKQHEAVEKQLMEAKKRMDYMNMKVELYKDIIAGNKPDIFNITEVEHKEN